MRRFKRDLYWIGGLALIASALTIHSSGFWLAMDFRLQMARGITLQWPQDPQGLYVFRGSPLSSQGVMQGQTVVTIDRKSRVYTYTGTYAFQGGKLRIHQTGGTDFDPKSPLDFTAVLEPGQDDERFAVRDDSGGDAIYGPVQTPGPTTLAAR